MDKTKILIIEDEEAIADLLAYGLGREGFETRTAGSGAVGMRELLQFVPDFDVLDWMLPDRSGLDLCKEITAKYNLPILMLTARSDITDKILGLEVGADVYITKPFDLREVVVRIRTILRRLAQAQPVAPEKEKERAPEVIQFRDIVILPEERLVTKQGSTVELTPKEFVLLIALIGAKGKIFTRAELLEFVWGYDFPGDMRNVDTHIQRLRKKLDAADIITTVFGIGYKFEKRID
ncbi:transcriptional regulatory protein WalR [Paenibacillus glycanilyticus]|uniref:Transcriptional regulatory protein WalR n=1 Tax=Paenibacillus glycanilyticus TaxID=126569 RepID=A0ABQ6NWH4_9BACL|nr:response regulator transcription factor [Paenibacillus glycanilyticus]GMK49194.1 transcriptional regulatory protein WalR [Paenibacillus glycanilyticus]